MVSLTASVLTISDRSFSGVREDLSGPKIIALLGTKNIQVTQYEIVPDDVDKIYQKLLQWIEVDHPMIIFTTGGTGFAPRDNTPEATKLIIEKETPGISEFIRLKSAQITPHAALSRAVSGIRGKTLIINLPGSPKAACENIEFIIDIIPHAVELIQNSPSAEENHILKNID